jgi:hypothetical protein
VRSSVNVTVAVDGDDSRAALESLFDWLRHEDALRGHIQLRPSTVTAGAMGPLDEALLVVLGSGGAASVLARCLTEWVKHRTSDVRLTLTRPNGETISVDGRRIRDPASLTDIVTRFVDEHAPDSDKTA